ncbi:hypothetical protein [Luteolibacter marinus]|uniref:hypothetical protein n=1 Tax=Luteolibacter marinus TaxID=2776705 RepID=UPI001865D55B|nr:hypothetical protein [Luteolibacter marinus]
MFSASKLSEEQKTALHAWAAEGASIADLQKRLKEDYEISITYMDARFLVLDLGIQLQDTPKEPEKEPEPDIPAEAPAAPGKVTTTMDHVALPGAMISGKVTFSDGETAIWMLDSTGRPGLDPDTVGYRPSQEDIMDFQKQLADLVRGGGF